MFKKICVALLASATLLAACGDDSDSNTDNAAGNNAAGNNAAGNNASQDPAARIDAAVAVAMPVVEAAQVKMCECEAADDTARQACAASVAAEMEGPSACEKDVYALDVEAGLEALGCLTDAFQAFNDCLTECSETKFEECWSALTPLDEENPESCLNKMTGAQKEALTACDSTPEEG